MDAASLWIALFGTAAAVASAVVAWFARADALTAQDAATAAAERAAVANERSLRMQESVFNSPPWNFEWWSGDTFLLTNTSSRDALEVDISTDPERLRIDVGMNPGATIGARSAIKIMYGATLADPWVKDIVVRWRTPEDDAPLVWRFPIPARPR